MFSFWGSTKEVSATEVVRKAKEDERYISELKDNDNNNNKSSSTLSLKKDDDDEIDNASSEKQVTKISNMEVTVYALNGFPEPAIVLAALDSRGIPHRCKIMSFSDGEYYKNMTPMNGGVVMEIHYKDSKTNQVSWAKLSKLQDILKWMDETYCQESYCLWNEMDQTIVNRAMEETLAGALWHISWVNEDGFTRSMRRIMSKETIPFFLPPSWGSPIADFHSIGYRAHFKAASRKVLKLSKEEDYFVDDDPVVFSKLVEELHYYQSLLVRQEKARRSHRAAAPPPQSLLFDKKNVVGVPYMLGGELPTSADFAVYGQLECLVGRLGEFERYPALRGFKEGTMDDLALLWKWHDKMTKLHPIEYKHKTKK